MEEKRYRIGEKTFVQRPLVLGQCDQLVNVLKGMPVLENLDAATLLASLGDNLFIVLAIILTEEGRTPKGKDLPSLADEIEWGIAPEMAVEAITDFFSFNPISSVLNAVKTLSTTLREKRTELEGIGSRSLSSSSAEEISPDGIGPSGT